MSSRRLQKVQIFALPFQRSSSSRAGGSSAAANTSKARKTKAERALDEHDRASKFEDALCLMWNSYKDLPAGELQKFARLQWIQKQPKADKQAWLKKKNYPANGTADEVNQRVYGSAVVVIPLISK